MNDLHNCNARDAIISLGNANGLYFIVWTGHFGQYFVAFENQRKIQTEIYLAIYESIYDIAMNDIVKFKFQISDCDTWESILIKLNLEYDLI